MFLSSITQLSFDNIVFTLEDIRTLVKRLKQEDGKNIWICGGQQFITH